jgi:hypothetical protein
MSGSFNGGGNCLNDIPQTEIVIVDTLNEPYTASQTYLDPFCGGIYTTAVIDGSGNIIAPSTCFNGASCSSVGIVPITITIEEFYQCP